MRPSTLRPPARLRRAARTGRTVRTVQDRLDPGYRRALPVRAVLVLDPAERQRALQAAEQDPDVEWVLEEFDGRAFVPRGVVRGPAARRAFLDGGFPPGP